MARLSIRLVKYDGDRWEYESPWLGDGLNILVGDNRTGKSTFADLIYYALGGRVEQFNKDGKVQHQEIVNDKDNSISLTIDIDDRRFLLKRFFGFNEIGVLSKDGKVEVYPLTRRGENRIFSDWLLNELGIEATPLYMQAGNELGKLNFTDVARLIYHNQLTDPSGIYKAADSGGWVPESKPLRKAIFEILTGKNFQNYYIALAQFRELEKQKTNYSTSLDFFKRFIAETFPSQEDLNLGFLKRRIELVTAQLEQTTLFRRSLTKAVINRPEVDTTSPKQELLSVEIKLSEIAREINDISNELSRLQRLKAELIIEVTQIKKMMFTHENLHLFSINTCPYCLRDVTRDSHRCVCGAEIDEADYEKFFYNNDEYRLILKSKQKNVQTVDAALASCKEEITELKASHDALTADSVRIKNFIASVVEQSDSVVDLTQFDSIDDKILGLRSELSKLEQQQSLEEKRQNLETDLATLEVKYHASKVKLAQLSAQTIEDMEQVRNKFSEIYQRFMSETVENCRTAFIDSDYMPVLNTREYREASVHVPKRFYYYLTLLVLSLEEPDVKFPRFLLVDTPETAGIDTQKLIACLSEMRKTLDARESPDCQIILTSGYKKYPPECEKNVFQFLSESEKLLKLKQRP